MLGTVQIVLVTQDADGHVGARDGGQLDGTRETLVTLGIIVLQADLELDGLKEVALLGLIGVLQEIGDLRPDISCEERLLARVHNMSNDSAIARTQMSEMGMLRRAVPSVVFIGGDAYRL